MNFFTLSLYCCLHAAPPDTLPFSGRIAAADIDVKGAVYVVDSAYRLCKWDHQKSSICNSVAQYGEGVIVDVDNPMEPMLFFQNTGMLLITDNQLNTTGSSSLLSQNNIKPGGFGRANDGQVWLFDDNSSTLKKLDRSGMVVQESMVLCTKGKANRKAGNILDNGLLIVLTTPQNTTLVLNMNLNVLAELDENEGHCADLAGNRLLMLNRGEIWLTEPFEGRGKRRPTSRQQTGMIFGGKLLSLRGNKTLSTTNGGLILQQH
jgi:hypothetical protein